MKLLQSLFLIFAVSTFAENEDSLTVYQSPAVTVTSTKAKFRESPVSFSEMSQEQIELKTTAVDLPQILNNQQSIYSYSENGNFMGYSHIRLRGFDQRRVSVYINGVPQNDPELHNVFWLNLNDIQESVGEIQVQRGAGLSNYGSPSIAGSINLTTTNFVNNPGVRLSLGGGFQTFGAEDEIRSNASKMKLEFSSGLVNEKYAFYGKVGRINSSGYRDNSWAQMDSWFLSAVRFDENLTTQINFFGGAQRDALAYVGVLKNNINNLANRKGNVLSSNEVESFSSPQFQLLNDWKINDNLSLKSTLFYFEGNGYFDYDGYLAEGTTFGFADSLFPSTPGFQNAVIRAFVGNKQGGWIPRLVWNHGSGELITGAEIRLHRSEHWSDLQYSDQYPTGFDRDFKINEYNSGKNVFSAFAREKFNVNDKLTLNLEGQLVFNQYIFGDERQNGKLVEYQTANGVVSGEEIFTLNYLFFNPRLGVNYKVNDKISAYTSLALTSREPRRNSIYNADFSLYGSIPAFATTLDSTSGNLIYDFDSPLLEPEQMLNVEIGGTFQSDYVMGNLNFYLMDYYNELIPSGQVDGFGVPIDGNAPRTVHYGVEIGGRHIWKLPYDGRLGFDFNVMYSINEINELSVNDTYFDVSDSTTKSIQLDLSGNQIAGFPDAIINLGLDFQIENLSLRFDGKFVSEIYINNYNEKQQRLINGDVSNIIDSYFVMDANLSYKLDNILGSRYILFKLQVNNLANELYAPFAAESGYLGGMPGFFVAAERNFWLGIELSI
jgi:iron complex outermembrane receptor protein